MKKLTLTVFTILACTSSLFAQDQKNYYVRSKGYSSNPESEPPAYVHQLDQTGIEAFKDLDWIDAGLTYRMRYEHRKNDFRRSDSRTDNALLTRTQAYFGIKNIIDPLRFALELQDSRINNTKYPKSAGDTNEMNLFQAYAELYFKDPILIDRPISLRVGRMAFEVMDRKLLSRDDWGNAGTNFEGARLIIGAKENDWQLDNFVLQPMLEKINKVDDDDDHQYLYGTILNWRRWSDIMTIQPFYFRFDQRDSPTLKKRQIYSPGIRFYGTIGNNFDYDFLGVYQTGTTEGQDHHAHAYTTELGYTFEHAYKPRLSFIYGYASGDKNPNDNKNQRFERLFGFNRPWSNSNSIEWENLETIKTRFELKPSQRLRMEGSYNFYWLASSTDEWGRANLQDTTGASGREIGQDLEYRVHYKISKHLKTTVGFAHFIPGDFTKSVGRGGSSDFIYVELTANIFGNK